MKVKDFIERLTKYNNLDDEIIVDYIPYRDVEGLFEDPLTKDEWKKFIPINYKFFGQEYNG